MRKPQATARAALVAALVLLTGCGNMATSKLNPLNWFRSAEPAPLVLAVRPADPRPLIAEVTTLKIEPYPGGAIIRATGLPPTQGWWSAELVRVESGETGVLVYDFRIFPPPGAQPAGAPRSREVTVATAISDITLEGVAKIVVQGAAGAMSSRR